jgi:leader peptidase (prepilin peptidase) / N-methyltransferase
VNAVPIVSAVAALPAGWFSGVLVDRVPDRLALRPLPGVRVEGRYLAIHVTMLGLFIGVGLRFDDAIWLRVVGYLLLAAMLVTVSAIDIACFRLPDRIVLPTLAASAVLVVAGSLREGRPSEITCAVAGAAIYFGILLVFHLISPGGMGFGDVKLAAVMGLYLGWLALGVGTAFVLVLWALGAGAIVATVVGAVMLGFQGRNRRTPIPFGPYLAFGTMLVVLLTPHLVTFSLSS